jgi:NADP-dependent 3-hydroxy acid dehydrogenase YdfG
MTSQELAGTTALVTGASRGFGRGIAVALAQAGARVVGVARDGGRLAELRDQLGGSFTAVIADAADPVAAGHLLDEYRPRTLVLNAGASRCRDRFTTRPGRRSAATAGLGPVQN